MARFTLARDIKFFESISRELVDVVIETAVVLYKLVIEDSKTNLYGESLNKTYYQGVETTAVIERESSTSEYEGFGSDKNQLVEFRFNRFTLEDTGFYPEVGDIIFHNNGYFEIDNVREDQMVGGQVDNKFSIICSTFMTRRSTIQTEMRIV
jgi:hypothetical protein